MKNLVAFTICASCITIHQSDGINLIEVPRDGNQDSDNKAQFYEKYMVRPVVPLRSFNVQARRQASKLAQQKSAVSPQKIEVSPQKPKVSPQKFEVSPQKSAVSPQKTKVSPQKPKFSPQKSEVSPQKYEVSPQKTEVSPQKYKVWPRKRADELNEEVTEDYELTNGSELFDNDTQHQQQHVSETTVPPQQSMQDDAAIKDKIKINIQSQISLADMAFESIRPVRDKYNDTAEYRTGYVMYMLQRCRDTMNELFNLAVNHREDWSSLEMIKTYELMDKTNTDASNLLGRVLEIVVRKDMRFRSRYSAWTKP